MNKISRYVMWNMRAEDKNELFWKVAKFLNQKELACNEKLIVDCFKEREALGSTLISNKIAAPHAQSNEFKNNAIILIRNDEEQTQWDEDYSVKYFVFCCLRKDINKSQAKELVNILLKFSNCEINDSDEKNTKELLLNILNG